MTTESQVNATSNLSDLRRREQAKMVRFLQRTLAPREARAALARFSTDSRGRSIEWIVAAAERKTPPPKTLRLSDDGVYELLVELAGPDLLADRELRRLIARNSHPRILDKLHEYPSATRGRGGDGSKANAVAQRKWHPGKSWAVHFVRTINMPLSFAGSRGSTNLPDTLDVEPCVKLPGLADFQLELFERLVEVLVGPDDANRAILSLPTGAGKTRTAVEALLKWRQSRDDRPLILWIAQSDELCEQAVQAFREVWFDLGHGDRSFRETLTIGRLWGDKNAEPSGCGVVVSSIQKLSAAAAGRGTFTGEQLESLQETVGVVVVDEAHRALAPSYGDVLSALGFNFRQKHGPTALIGLTATPRRSSQDETARLRRRFHNNILTAPSLGADPVQTLRGRGVLARIEEECLDYDADRVELSTTTAYAEHYEAFDDVHPDVLTRLGEEHRRNRRLIERLLDLDPTWPVLVFACSVQHAQALSSLLRRRGRSSACVLGTTRPATRRAIVEQFRNNELSVLCNYGVLTTGFDAPSVRCVVVARPTTSNVLYEQMVGRGMRGPAFGGTEKCLIIDVEDNIQWRSLPATVHYSALEREMRHAR
ncbi:DEAD/DEAH box helicase [Mycolicibacterium flavescens]|uniref:DEAD/DEAH box helicase n=1 Tax=Mycolicibacterium flavescens TaxID=1776 RepID=UPI00197C73AB|nr:DEAD/DEAH box helicase [Mycolicibacterium flavescens]MCV7281684.1 DEAD/DEAH box helicase [Mycolicibacterium flavescens]